MLMNRMTLAALVLAAAIGSRTESPKSKSLTGNQCLPADSLSADLIGYVTGLITTTDSARAVLRAAAGLTGVNPSSVALSSDSTTCAKVAAALDAMANVTNSGRLIYVVTAGTKRIIAEDPNGIAGEHLLVTVFDNHEKFVKLIAR